MGSSLVLTREMWDEGKPHLISNPSQENIKLFLTALETKEATAAMGDPRTEPMGGSWRSQAWEHGLERMETQTYRIQRAQRGQYWTFLNCWVPHILVCFHAEERCCCAHLLSGKPRPPIRCELTFQQCRGRADQS